MWKLKTLEKERPNWRNQPTEQRMQNEGELDSGKKLFQRLLALRAEVLVIIPNLSLLWKGRDFPEEQIFLC